MKKAKEFKYGEGKWWVLLEKFIEWLRAHNYSESTVQTRYNHIILFIAWCNERGILEPKYISVEQLERYQIWSNNYRKSNTRYLSVETQAQRITSVKMFFRYMFKSKYLDYDPSTEITLPKVVKKLPKALLNSNETEKVLGCADLSTSKGKRDRAMMEVLYSTAIRRAELTNLKLEDLDKERGLLWIRGGKGAKDRVVPIGERAIAFLELYLEKVRPLLASLSGGQDEAIMFLNKDGLPFALEGVGNTIRQYIKKAELGLVGSCHIFRHTCATLMLEGGADIRYIQEMLGHNSLATTQIYTKVSGNKLKEVHTRTHPSAKLLEPIIKEQSSDEEPTNKD